MSANTPTRRRRPRILLGITGSVAAVKGPELALRLLDRGMDVRILLTRGGQNFWDKAEDYNGGLWKQVQERLELSSKTRLEAKNQTEGRVENNSQQQEEGILQIHDASEEWRNWNQMGDPVLHIDLRDWADALVIAPLCAHTLAKLSHGLCDDTLSCVVRAWDLGHGTRPGKPLLLAPAMNTAMWQHPLTQPQLKTLQGFWNAQHPLHNGEGVRIVEPQVKTLACGEVGNGAMAAVEDIIRAVEEAINMAPSQMTSAG